MKIEMHINPEGRLYSPKIINYFLKVWETNLVCGAGPFSAPPEECGTARVQVMKEGKDQQPDVGIFLTPISFHTDKGLLTPFTYGMQKHVRILSKYITCNS